jgi:hypothetical protein
VLAVASVVLIRTARKMLMHYRTGWNFVTQWRRGNGTSAGRWSQHELAQHQTALISQRVWDRRWA